MNQTWVKVGLELGRRGIRVGAGQNGLIKNVGADWGGDALLLCAEG